MTTPVRGRSVDHMGWLSELHALVDAANQAVYEAVVGTATPCPDRLLVGVSNAANLGLEPPRSPAATRPVGGPSRAGLPPHTAAGLHVIPSGHAASATVAYPRVHPGVHHPSDVAVGAVTGNVCRGAVRHLAPRAATLR